MAKKLPKKVYVNWKEEGTENEFLSINEKPSGAIEETNDRVRVGVYELVGILDVVNATTATPVHLK